MTSLAQAQDIHLESLNNGPGILPFKLGPAKITSHYHTFLQDIDLEQIHKQVNLTRTQLNNAANNMTNRYFPLFKNQILHLFDKIDILTSQLNSLQPKRVKRGLLNPLGSFIKSVTGNLDYNDALRYEHIFKILQDNNLDLSNSLGKHITLFKQMSTHQSEILTNLTNNQRRLEKTIEHFLNYTGHETEQVARYAYLSQIFTLINENVLELSLEIDRIENIVAFSRTGTVHHSILSLDNIDYMLSKLKDTYDPDQIINLVDIRYYYDLISLGNYFIDRKIVIVLKFPIATPLSYYLYSLCPVPNQNHIVLIPPSPYLATNSKEYAYMEAECPKIGTLYVCEQQLNHQTRTQRDCIFNLIHQQVIDETCNPTPITLSKEALMELDSKHYILSFQEPTKVKLLCGEERYQTLEGSFLAAIPKTCSIRTPKFTVTNVNDNIRGQNFEILTFPHSELLELSISRNQTPHYNLSTIDLTKLHDIQNQVIMQNPTQPRQANISELSTYHTTIPMYALLLFGAAALIIAYLARRRRQTGKSETQKSIIEIQQITPATSKSCDTPDISSADRKAAIFALNVDK